MSSCKEAFPVTFYPVVVQYLELRHLQAEFDNEDVAGDFRDMFAEGKDLAEQSEILEQPGGIEGNPQVGTLFHTFRF